MIYDLRSERSPAPVRGIRKIKTINGKPVIRDPSSVVGIVLHQTDCVFGAKRGQPRYRRALDVACHALAFETGECVLAAPLPWYVNHANAFNPETLCLEIEGVYAGEGVGVLTRRTLETAMEALHALVCLGRAEGMPLVWLYAHRQSSAMRRRDPSQEIWSELVPYARTLGLETDPDLTLGKGRAIPESWEPRGSAVKY